MRADGRPRALLLAALALLSVPARAGIKADLRVLGFSPDGRYFAFEDSGPFDAVEGHWSRIVIVDAAADALARPAFTTSRPNEDASKTEVPLDAVRAENLRKAAPSLRALGVKLGDEGAAPALAEGRFGHAGAAYELQLSTKAFPSPDCRDGEGSVGYTLVLKDARGPRTLHGDVRVPRSRGGRGCVLGYALREVRAKGKYLIVLLDVTEPGFEGPSVGRLAAAATLE